MTSQHGHQATSGLSTAQRPDRSVPRSAPLVTLWPHLTPTALRYHAEVGLSVARSLAARTATSARCTVHNSSPPEQRLAPRRMSCVWAALRGVERLSEVAIGHTSDGGGQTRVAEQQNTAVRRDTDHCSVRSPQPTRDRPSRRPDTPKTGRNDTNDRESCTGTVHPSSRPLGNGTARQTRCTKPAGHRNRTAAIAGEIRGRERRLAAKCPPSAPEIKTNGNKTTEFSAERKEISYSGGDIAIRFNGTLCLAEFQTD